MRKVALLVTALAVACFGVVGVSSAINGKAGLKMKVTPSKAGTKKSPKNITLFTDVITEPAADDQPFATKTTVVHFDKNLVFGGSALPSCSQTQVQYDDTKCPKGSKVGTGAATGKALGQTENLKVVAFNGPGGNKIELHVTGQLAARHRLGHRGHAEQRHRSLRQEAVGHGPGQPSAAADGRLRDPHRLPGHGEGHRQEAASVRGPEGLHGREAELQGRPRVHRRHVAVGDGDDALLEEVTARTV